MQGGVGVGGGGVARLMCIRFHRMVLWGVCMVLDLEWRFSVTRPYTHGLPGLLVGGLAYTNSPISIILCSGPAVLS